MGAIIGLVKVSNVACTSSSFEVHLTGTAVTVLSFNGGVGTIDDGGGEVLAKVVILTGRMFSC